MDERYARINAAGVVSYFLTDAMGSTIALTDSNGVVQTTYKYGPFGATNASGAANDNPYQFIGRELDPMTGGALYYMRARYLDTGMGRFVTRDPQGLLGSNFLAMYSYASDNPLAELDPTGQDPFSDAFGAAYAAGFGLGFLSGFAGALVPDSAAAFASDASMVGSGASTISTFQATAPSALQTLAGYLSAATFVYRVGGYLGQAYQAGVAEGDQTGTANVDALNAYLGESALGAVAFGSGITQEDTGASYGPGNFSVTIRTRSDRHPNTGGGQNPGGINGPSVPTGTVAPTTPPAESKHRL